MLFVPRNLTLSFSRKLSLCLLFSVGCFVISVSAIRLSKVVKESSLEGRRIVWSTAEILAATFVANARAIYAFSRTVAFRDMFVSQASSST